MIFIGSKTKVVSIAIIAFSLLAIPLTLLATRKPTETRSLAAQGISEDLNGDGKIDVSDIAVIRSVIASKKYVKAADLNRDAKVDGKDIEKFYQLYSLK